jgi:hypothetical protein
MTATGGAPFATTMRVIHRVHRNTTNRWPYTTPARRTGLAQLAGTVFFIPNLTYRSAAGYMNSTHFARAQAYLGIISVTRHELSRCPSRASDLPTLTWPHLNVVHHRAHGNTAEWHAITRLYGRLLSGEHRITNGHAFCRENIATFAVNITNQCNVSRTIGVVLQALYLTKYIHFIALEIYQAIVRLVSTTLVTPSNTPEIVATATMGLCFNKSRMRISLMEA